MTASLRVKNDKYYVVLTHTTDGKKNQTWVSTGLSVTGNEGKARQLMLDMLGEKPEQAAPPDMLFSDAVRRWLEDVRHRVDEVTYQGYEVQARAHILPYFDDLQIRLCDVDGETLQTYINVKAKFGRSDGHGGLSAVSLRQHKNVLNQTLKLAQRDGLIQTNPADLVVMPHAAQFTGTFYTEAQMRDLLTAVKNERLYPIIYVTALYGLRRSEVLGLKWDSINFAMQTLTIRHTVARVTKVVEKNKTKNASSFRSFPLTDDAVRLFKILLQQEQYYRNHYGKDYIDNDYVFTWEDGHPYSPDYVSHTFHKLLKKYDLPHIRFHDLRQHAAVGGLRPEGRAGVAGPLGHQDDRKHLRPSGHTPQAFHCQRLGASAAAIEAVKNKKRQILSDLTLLLTLTATFGPSGESGTHGLLNPIQARYKIIRSMVGFYMIFVLYGLQWVVFHYFFELFDCHFCFFGCTLWLQITVSNKLNEHPNLTDADALFSAFGLDALTKVAHNKHLFQFFAHCNAKLFFENFLFLRSCS